MSIAQPPPCTHKAATTCLVTGVSKCCACCDERPQLEVYEVYVDGRGLLPRGNRWSFYCSSCRDFWSNQLLHWGVPASATRIPHWPAPIIPAPASTSSTMDPSSSRQSPSRRRTEGAVTGTRRQRQPGDCDEDDVRRPHPPRRTTGYGRFAPVITTARTGPGRNRGLNTPADPSPRIQPEEVTAHIIRHPENYLERLRSLEGSGRSNELRDEPDSELESEQYGYHARMRSLLESGATRRRLGADPSPEAVVEHIGTLGEALLRRSSLFGDRYATPALTTPRSPGDVRLSSSFAEGANGSAHNDDEEGRRSVRQQLGDLVRDGSSEQNSILPGPPNSTRRHRGGGMPAIHNPLNAAEWRSAIGQWRLENGLDDIDSEMDYMHEAAVRRTQLETARRTLTRALRRMSPVADDDDSVGRSSAQHHTPPSRATEDAPSPADLLAARRVWREGRGTMSPVLDDDSIGRSPALHHTPPSRATEDAPSPASFLAAAEGSAANAQRRGLLERRERARALWPGADIDAEEYISPLPISSLYHDSSRIPHFPRRLMGNSFRNTWATHAAEMAHNSEQLLESLAQRDRTSPTSPASPTSSTSPTSPALPTPPAFPIPPPRSPATLVQPNATARTHLRHLQYIRDVMAADPGARLEHHHRRRREPINSLDKQKGRPAPLESEDMKLDCECKICFGQIADTVLLPCAHLVVCQWCADQIGAKKKDQLLQAHRLAQPPALCPMCRAVVSDRIKVFRG